MSALDKVKQGANSAWEWAKENKVKAVLLVVGVILALIFMQTVTALASAIVAVTVLGNKKYKEKRINEHVETHHKEMSEKERAAQVDNYHIKEPLDELKWKAALGLLALVLMSIIPGGVGLVVAAAVVAGGVAYSKLNGKVEEKEHVAEANEAQQKQQQSQEVAKLRQQVQNQQDQIKGLLQQQQQQQQQQQPQQQQPQQQQPQQQQQQQQQQLGQNMWVMDLSQQLKSLKTEAEKHIIQGAERGPVTLVQQLIQYYKPSAIKYTSQDFQGLINAAYQSADIQQRRDIVKLFVGETDEKDQSTKQSLAAIIPEEILKEIATQTNATVASSVLSPLSTPIPKTHSVGGAGRNP
jgi:hypothetical protein